MSNPTIRRSCPALPALAAVLTLMMPTPTQAQVGLGTGQLGRDSTPSQAYFRAIEQLYEGDYRNAERTFRRELRGAIKIGINGRWLDTIAYHAMLGETYYHQGRLADALEQFDQACRMYLQNSNWMIRVDFKRDPVADTNRLRQPLPWGQSTRKFSLGRFSDQELINIGSFQGVNRAVQRGGALQTPQLWRLNVHEIVRATTLAISRRSEILGPLSPEDTITRELVTALSRGITIPNHWSKRWADVMLGVAQAAAGQPDQAEKYLVRAERVRNQYDHPLTCVALLELGRLKMEAGDLSAANNLLLEASYSAFYFDNLGVIDEALRLLTMSHLASNPNSLHPVLQPAANWTSRRRHHHISVRLNLALAEESLHLGNLKDAQAMLTTARARMRNAASGLLGARFLYLDAYLQLLQGRESATDALAQAVQQQIGVSKHHLQLRSANQRYDQQQILARSAVSIYRQLLSDPPPTAWILRPFETLASLQTPRDQAYGLWLDAILSRKSLASAIEVTDLAKRHRYHVSLAWGGRLAALRDTLESPEHLQIQQVRNQRNELLLRFPKYEQVLKAGRELKSKLSTRWQPGIDAQEQGDLVKLWRSWANNLNQRESMLRQMAMQRTAVDMQFPPVVAATTLQNQLRPGQALVVFHELQTTTLGFLLTSEGSTSWQCAPKKQLSNLVGKFLRELGNYDANHEMPIADLLTDDWQATGTKLYDALFEGSALDPAALDELIVVPDGLTWYVPFAALPVQPEEDIVPLIATSKIRFAPTAGLALGHSQPWRRVQRTAIVGQDLLPGESDAEQAAALESLRKAVENPVQFPNSSPAPTPIMGSLLETLVVLNDVELELSQPLAWTPIPSGRKSKNSSLDHWLTLPQFGPQRVVMPAARTLAERGGKASKRKAANTPPGTELFLASCGLMSSGAQTILLSSWRIGGEATLELTREFLQELPYTNAASAWQRSVQLARELPLNVAQQPRVKLDKKQRDLELTANHPFFWAGYLLIDTGAPAPAEADEPLAKEPSAAPEQKPAAG